jgi:hypothetical protein
MTTAEAVEQGRFEDIDRENLAEEIRGLARSERRALDSQLKRIMLHLLKIKYQPLKHSTSWDTTIRNARTEIGHELRDSPSLKPEVAYRIERMYELARAKAAEETGQPLENFPEECPFSVEEVLGYSLSNT